MKEQNNNNGVNVINKSSPLTKEEIIDDIKLETTAPYSALLTEETAIAILEYRQTIIKNKPLKIGVEFRNQIINAIKEEKKDNTKYLSEEEESNEIAAYITEETPEKFFQLLYNVKKAASFAEDKANNPHVVSDLEKIILTNVTLYLPDITAYDNGAWQPREDGQGGKRSAIANFSTNKPNTNIDFFGTPGPVLANLNDPTAASLFKEQDIKILQDLSELHNNVKNDKTYIKELANAIANKNVPKNIRKILQLLSNKKINLESKKDLENLLEKAISNQIKSMGKGFNKYINKNMGNNLSMFSSTCAKNNEYGMFLSPGFSCGYFSGTMRPYMPLFLENAWEFTLQNYKGDLTHLSHLVLDTHVVSTHDSRFKDRKPLIKKIKTKNGTHSVEFLVAPLNEMNEKHGQLASVEDHNLTNYNEKKVTRKAVGIAADPLSLLGNDANKGSRFTDEGSKFAGTNAAEKMFGITTKYNETEAFNNIVIKGVEYSSFRAEHNKPRITFEDVIEKKNIKCIFDINNINIENGKFSLKDLNTKIGKNINTVSITAKLLAATSTASIKDIKKSISNQDNARSNSTKERYAKIKFLEKSIDDIIAENINNYYTVLTKTQHDLIASEKTLLTHLNAILQENGFKEVTATNQQWEYSDKYKESIINNNRLFTELQNVSCLEKIETNMIKSFSEEFKVDAADLTKRIENLQEQKIENFIEQKLQSIDNEFNASYVNMSEDAKKHEIENITQQIDVIKQLNLTEKLDKEFESVIADTIKVKLKYLLRTNDTVKIDTLYTKLNNTDTAKIDSEIANAIEKLDKERSNNKKQLKTEILQHIQSNKINLNSINTKLKNYRDKEGLTTYTAPNQSNDPNKIGDISIKDPTAKVSEINLENELKTLTIGSIELVIRDMKVTKVRTKMKTDANYNNSRGDYNGVTTLLNTTNNELNKLIDATCDDKLSGTIRSRLNQIATDKIQTEAELLQELGAKKPENSNTISYDDLYTNILNSNPTLVQTHIQRLTDYYAYRDKDNTTTIKDVLTQFREKNVCELKVNLLSTLPINNKQLEQCIYNFHDTLPNWQKNNLNMYENHQKFMKLKEEIETIPKLEDNDSKIYNNFNDLLEKKVASLTPKSKIQQFMEKIKSCFQYGNTVAPQGAVGTQVQKSGQSVGPGGVNN